MFRGINGAFKATRYHSLVVDEATLPAELDVTARSEDGTIMGLSHRGRPVHGVQFHPESIASENGRVILKNFLDLAEAWNAAHPRGGRPAPPARADGRLQAAARQARHRRGADPRRGRIRLRPPAVGRGHPGPDRRLPDGPAGPRRDRRRDHRRGRGHAAQDAARGAPEDAIDIVGTGGDGSGSYNVSTLAAIIVAACGVPVAKHGNRAASSRSGASDVLSALGVRVGGTPAEVERCMAEAGIGFMMASAHHAAMRHVASARVELGTRTIFNLLGPLSNPAGVRHQLLGVFSRAWLEPLAAVLRNAGSRRVWVVHGSDGLDEMTTTGPTSVAELRDGAVRLFEVTPEEAGLPRGAAADLRGGDPAHNARALRAVLDGARTPYRDVAVLNAAGALVVAGRAGTLRDGAELAGRALDGGLAADTLRRLVAASNAEPAARSA